jgi:predicted lipoprotein with Yx(FWY)xxD motif
MVFRVRRRFPEMKRLVLLVVSCFALVVPGFTLAQDDSPVAVAETPELGQFLTDAEGMTLYLFTKDEPGKSNCYDQCEENWPVFMADSTTLPEGVAGELTVITRDDGTEQLAYNGWPLYYWVQDQAPGDTTGQGVGDVWYVVEVADATTPPAPPVEEEEPAASPEASPMAMGGGALMVAETPELGQFLTDAEGMTLYIFTNDEMGSGVSVCNDDCAVNWPPFYVEGATLPEGVPGELTEITRDDGSMQLAYNGMPLYYYIDDQAPGDTTGHEKGDVWYVAAVGDM